MELEETQKIIGPELAFTMFLNRFTTEEQEYMQEVIKLKYPDILMDWALSPSDTQ